MRVSDWHNFKRIHNTCGANSLATLMAQNKLRWLGHVARMAGGRYPHIAIFVQIQGAHYGLDQPQQSFMQRVCEDFMVASMSLEGEGWYEQVKDKTLWRGMVQGLEFKVKVPGAPTRK